MPSTALSPRSIRLWAGQKKPRILSILCRSATNSISGGEGGAAFEAALGEATAEEAELAETRLLLTTAVARSYIGGATFGPGLALIRDMVKVRRQSLNVAQTRFHTGLGPADAIVQASVDLENVVRLEASTRSLLIMQQNSARPPDGRGA